MPALTISCQPPCLSIASRGALLCEHGYLQRVGAPPPPMASPLSSGPLLSSQEAMVSLQACLALSHCLDKSLGSSEEETSMRQLPLTAEQTLRLPRSLLHSYDYSEIMLGFPSHVQPLWAICELAG